MRLPKQQSKRVVRSLDSSLETHPHPHTLTPTPLTGEFHVYIFDCSQPLVKPEESRFGAVLLCSILLHIRT